MEDIIIINNNSLYLYRIKTRSACSEAAINQGPVKIKS